MNKGGLPFIAAITGALLLPSLTACLPCERNDPATLHLAYQLGRWQGVDLPVTDQIRKTYEPLQASFLWRRYALPAQLPVECVIQQATNCERIHDLHSCLVYSGTTPKRLGAIKISGLHAPQRASLFEYNLHNQHYFALFSYQWKAGAVNYPPDNILDQAQLALVGRVPCRLTEISTPIGGNRQAAISRLKEIAAVICAQPL